ncbi:hypothetical protein [Aestuariivirga sp.]|uniref:hypothetical protein n=1 Tax=Aestuariivirga sp. TaxID=2650926 RepID=UPI0039E6A02D
MERAKREFLAVHDYQTGGVWVIVYARSKEEIAKRFPLLHVVLSRPAWLTETHYADIRSRFYQDIDKPSEVWFAALS